MGTGTGWRVSLTFQPLPNIEQLVGELLPYFPRKSGPRAAGESGPRNIQNSIPWHPTGAMSSVTTRNPLLGDLLLHLTR